MFRKVVAASVAQNEIELQSVAFKYGFTPRIYEVVQEGDYWTLLMEDLGEENTLAQIYGDDPINIPENIWNQIRNIVQILIEEEGIEYVDITPYNFIEKYGKVYVVDFGDAKYTENGGEVDCFLQEFLDGENTWNPDFK
jgi:tRNA A-37 threonylcarbamoyl transferase component Bud32